MTAVDDVIVRRAVDLRVLLDGPDPGSALDLIADHLDVSVLTIIVDLASRKLDADIKPGSTTPEALRACMVAAAAETPEPEPDQREQLRIVMHTALAELRSLVSLQHAFARVAGAIAQVGTPEAAE